MYPFIKFWAHYMMRRFSLKHHEMKISPVIDLNQEGDTRRSNKEGKGRETAHWI